MANLQQVADGSSRPEGRVVGSIGGGASPRSCSRAEAEKACDLVEIRLDHGVAEGWAEDAESWAHLRGFPLLFTARRQDEGGAVPASPAQRRTLLQNCLADAALIDLEVASIDEMGDFPARLSAATVPWIASMHDFNGLPAWAGVERALERARQAGAAIFKFAARLHSTADLARLADFQSRDHGMPVALMGMGPLAAVSRILCAQCGGALHYGYLGPQPTAPGQWHAATLREVIRQVPRWQTDG